MTQEITKHRSSTVYFIRGVLCGALVIIACNTFDKVITVNVWPNTVSMEKAP